GASHQAQMDPSAEQPQINTAHTLKKASEIILAEAVKARMKDDIPQPQQEV
ncbi:hypothetical protein MKW92_035584, partial [Papaver armeniacum]